VDKRTLTPAPPLPPPRCRLLAERGKLKGVLDSVKEAREGLEKRAYEQELQVGGFGGLAGAGACLRSAAQAVASLSGLVRGGRNGAAGGLPATGGSCAPAAPLLPAAARPQVETSLKALEESVRQYNLAAHRCARALGAGAARPRPRLARQSCTPLAPLNLQFHIPPRTPAGWR
jgi:hypothetical protein